MAASYKPMDDALDYRRLELDELALIIGRRLSDELERIAREAGAASIVVSAAPSVNTVDFYRRRGYEPMADPLPELFELEPEDIHMSKEL